MGLGAQYLGLGISGITEDKDHIFKTMSYRLSSYHNKTKNNGKIYTACKLMVHETHLTVMLDQY